MATTEQREALRTWLGIRREIGYDESERTQKQIDEIVAAVLEDAENYEELKEENERLRKENEWLKALAWELPTREQSEELDHYVAVTDFKGNTYLYQAFCATLRFVRLARKALKEDDGGEH